MKLLFSVLIFVFATFSVFSCATNANTEDAVKVENTAKITGRVQIYGNEPFTFVGIIDEADTEYAVHPPEVADELRRLQGRLIEFTVIFLDEAQGMGGMMLRGGTVTPLSWEIIR